MTGFLNTALYACTRYAFVLEKVFFEKVYWRSNPRIFQGFRVILMWQLGNLFIGNLIVNVTIEDINELFGLKTTKYLGSNAYI